VVVYGVNGLLPTGQVRGVHRNTPAELVDALLRERPGEQMQVHVCVWMRTPGTSLCPSARPPVSSCRFPSERCRIRGCGRGGYASRPARAFGRDGRTPLGDLRAY
jgi:hypothetical protein